jgi:serine/threonine protein kinase
VHACTRLDCRRRKADEEVYCIKQIDIAAVTPEEEEEAVREVHLLASFDHRYVIRYFDSFVDDEMLHIVMEYAANGTLVDRIKQQVDDATAPKAPYSNHPHRTMNLTPPNNLPM